MVLDPHSGRYRRTRLFVLTLGFSRKCVRLLTFRSSSRIWTGPRLACCADRCYRIEQSGTLLFRMPRRICP